MIRARLLLLPALLAALPLFGASRTYTIGPTVPGVASFELRDKVEPVDGTTSAVTGTIVADPADVSAASVELSVDLTNLDTGMSLRNHHMRDNYIETKKFPKATFKSVSVKGPASIAPNTPVEIQVTGDFTLHGVTRRITTPVRVVLVPASERAATDRAHATASLELKLSDYGIKVPESFVEDTINVTIDVFGLVENQKAESRIRNGSIAQLNLTVKNSTATRPCRIQDQAFF